MSTPQPSVPTQELTFPPSPPLTGYGYCGVGQWRAIRRKDGEGAGSFLGDGLGATGTWRAIQDAFLQQGDYWVQGAGQEEETTISERARVDLRMGGVSVY